MKLLLQPLQGQDPSSARQLCLLDFLSTLKPVCDGIIHTVLSKMVEISCPGAPLVASSAVQPSVRTVEASKPPAAEPSTAETFTEGKQH